MQRVSLNRSERMYLGIEGIFPTAAPVCCFSLSERVEPERVRAACRALVRTVPRWRSVVRRTWRGYRLEVRDNNEVVDVLFDESFKVDDTQSETQEFVERRMEEQLRLPFAVERDLLVRFVYFPNAAQPSIMIHLHHIVADGSTVINSLRVLQSFLNGVEVQEKPFDSPPLWHAQVPNTSESWWAFVVQPFVMLATLVAGLFRFKPATHMVSWQLSPTKYFSSNRVLIYTFVTSPARIRTAAQAAGVSSLVAISVALSRALAEWHGQQHQQAGHAPTATRFVRTRWSVDVREAFPRPGPGPEMGNYAIAVTTDVTPSMMSNNEAARLVSNSLRQKREAVFERRAAWEALLLWMSTWVGRYWFGWFATKFRQGYAIAKESFHLSSLGNNELCNQVNGNTVDALRASVATGSAFVLHSRTADAHMLTVSLPSHNFAVDAVRPVLQRADEILNNWADEPTPPTAATAASGPLPQATAPATNAV